MRTIFYCLAAAVAMLATGGVLLAQKQAQPLRPAAPKAVPKAPTKVESNLTKAPDKPAAPAAATPSHEADDKAIRQLAEEYTKAYNAHDSKALADLFTTEAQIVDESGDDFLYPASNFRVLSDADSQLLERSMAALAA